LLEVSNPGRELDKLKNIGLVAPESGTGRVLVPVGAAYVGEYPAAVNEDEPVKKRARVNDEKLRQWVESDEERLRQACYDSA